MPVHGHRAGSEARGTPGARRDDRSTAKFGSGVEQVCSTNPPGNSISTRTDVAEIGAEKNWLSRARRESQSREPRPITDFSRQ